MRRFAVRLALAVVAVSALAWPPLRHWLSDVLSVTAHHLDHGPDAPPPAAAIERARRGFAGYVADALVQRGQARASATDECRHDSNGRQPI